MKTTTVPTGWDATEKTIHRTFRTGTFKRGLDFITRLADLAEQRNHHPDIIFTSATVIVTLISHDVMAITDRDIAMANEINALWKSFSGDARS